MIIIKIGIVTRNLISDTNASINGIPNTYLDIIKKEHYPVIIDGALDLKKQQQIISNILKEIDGFILPGGNEISELDLFIIEHCYNNDIPLLGICLGMQEIGIYFDKNNLVKLNEFSHFDMNKKYLHDITINKTGYLYKLLKQDKINVNSRHKYHLLYNSNYDIEAYKDDIIEAIKVKNKKYILGVQFHPEIMYEYDDNAKIIFDDFFTIVKNKS